MLSMNKTIKLSRDGDRFFKKAARDAEINVEMEASKLLEMQPEQMTIEVLDSHYRNVNVIKNKLRFQGCSDKELLRALNDKLLVIVEITKIKANKLAKMKPEEMTIEKLTVYSENIQTTMGLATIKNNQHPELSIRLNKQLEKIPEIMAERAVDLLKMKPGELEIRVLTRHSNSIMNIKATLAPKERQYRELLEELDKKSAEIAERIETKCEMIKECHGENTKDGFMFDMDM
jgi:hypothetical protein